MGFFKKTRCATNLIFTLGFTLLCGCGEDKFSEKGSAFGGGNTLDGAGDPVVVRKTQNFAGRYTQMTDILAVIDNSGSMAQEIATVKAQLEAFHSELNSLRTNDYRLALIHTDAYVHEGKLNSYEGVSVVNGTGVNPVALMANLIGTLRATARSGWEQGLKSSELALRANPTFLRAGAELAVIYVSDEEDYSCTDTTGDTAGKNCEGLAENLVAERLPLGVLQQPTPQYYVDFLKSLSRPVMVYSIVGVPNIRCEEQSKGTRYDAVRAGINSGFTAPICNADLANHFTRIATEISRRGLCYRLDFPVWGDTGAMKVRVNSVAWPLSEAEGYWYDDGTQSVCFSGNRIPQEGSVIAVDFDTLEP